MVRAHNFPSVSFANAPPSLLPDDDIIYFSANVFVSTMAPSGGGPKSSKKKAASTAATTPVRAGVRSIGANDNHSLICYFAPRAGTTMVVPECLWTHPFSGPLKDAVRTWYVYGDLFFCFVFFWRDGGSLFGSFGDHPVSWLAMALLVVCVVL